MKQFAVAGILALLAAPVQATTLAGLFSSFYVIGDSLSDNRNAATLLAPPPLTIVPAQRFAQQEGVASDGFTWAREFTDAFGPSGYNLSFAGARARDIVGLVPNLTAQVFTTAPVTFTIPDLSNTPTEVTRPLYPDGGAGLLSRLGDGSARELVTVFIGGNDFRDAVVSANPALLLSEAFTAI